jgi:hypothetical protein
VAGRQARAFPEPTAITTLREHAGHDLIEHGIVEVKMQVVRVTEPGTA